MSKTCLFCGAGGPGGLTNEHVNPKWLLSYLHLPDGDRLFQGVASSETGQLVEPPRVHSTYNFVDGRVCEACNSGWMSRLESAAKTALTSLIDQRRSLESLSRDEAQLIGKWAAKTAYLHSWVSPLKQPVQLSHLRALHGDGGVVAPGVGVFGMQCQYVQPTAYVQTGHWPQLAGAETAETHNTPASAYKVALQFRHLYLLVAFWPHFDVRSHACPGHAYPAASDRTGN